jgi:excisionase family DNA binding protein
MTYRVRVTRVQEIDVEVSVADSGVALRRAVESSMTSREWRMIEIRGEVEPAQREALPAAAAQERGGPLVVSVAEAAECLGVSRALMYDLVRDGTVPAVQLGSRRVIAKRTLEELVAGQD